MHGRVDIAKVPFIGWDLAVGLHVPLARQEIQLLLCKQGIYDGEWDAVESGVPSREEWVLPP